MMVARRLPQGRIEKDGFQKALILAVFCLQKEDEKEAEEDATGKSTQGKKPTEKKPECESDEEIDEDDYDEEEHEEVTYIIATLYY